MRFFGWSKSETALTYVCLAQSSVDELVFKIDFIDGKTISWEKTESGVEPTRHRDYRPRFYIEGERSKLHKSRPWLTRQDGVVATSFKTWKPCPLKKICCKGCVFACILVRSRGLNDRILKVYMPRQISSFFSLSHGI